MSNTNSITTSQVLNMVRTIHPVGQGGFYTEIFRASDSGKEICFVYDCGSKTIKRAAFKHILLSSIPDRMDVEALFISHFDEDHVNGISILAKERRIKRIIMPQIERYEWFYILTDCFENDRKEADAKITDRIRGICSEYGIPLIQVAPSEYYESVYRDGDTNRINIEDLTSIRILANGCSLDFRSVWEYIPINTSDQKKIDILKCALDDFFKELHFEKMEIDKMPASEIVEIISTYRCKINTIYKRVFNNSNNASMCLYSGSYNSGTVSLCYTQFACSCYSRIPFRPFGRERNKDACLYTGDADLTCIGLRNHISRVLSSKNNKIGMIQIPHHGSIHNSDAESLFELGGRYSIQFVSYGNHNTYGHPSHYLISTLLHNTMCVLQVTEDQNSAIYQKIIVEK